MEKGFKINLHREGFSDKQILNAVVTTKKERGQRRKTQLDNSPKKELNHDQNLLDDTCKVHPILNLPGIKKKIAGYIKAELLCLQVMFSNSDQEYTKEDLCLAVGIGRPKDFANFKKIQKDGLIEKGKKPRTYKANLSLTRITK